LRLYHFLLGLVVLAMEQEVLDIGESLVGQALLQRQVTDDGLDQLVPPLYDVFGRPDRRTQQSQDEQKGGVSGREVLDVLVVYQEELFLESIRRPLVVGRVFLQVAVDDLDETLRQRDPRRGNEGSNRLDEFSCRSVGDDRVRLECVSWGGHLQGGLRWCSHGCWMALLERPNDRSIWAGEGP